MKKMIAKIIENDNINIFEKELNKYLNDGYYVESSSCNSRTWKAILTKEVELDEGIN